MSEDMHGRHDMQLAHTYPSGAEEWHCPHCGRRFVMAWPPRYTRVILVPGDEFASHHASKGGMALTRARFTDPTEPVEPANSTRPSNTDLGLWEEWLDQIDFGDDEAETPLP